MAQLSQEEQAAKTFLAEKYKEAFYVMFAQYVLNGMDVKTAIFQCWNNLECGGSNE